MPPKLVPVMVMGVVEPTNPEAGEMLVIPGVTLKLALLLATPSTVTTTGALPTPSVEGTGTTMLPSLQLEGVVATPPMVIVLVRWAGLKLLPLTVINAPTWACAGDTVVMAGGGSTVNVTPVPWLTRGLVPVMVSDAGPITAAGAAVSVKMELPPPETVDGLKE